MGPEILKKSTLALKPAEFLGKIYWVNYTSDVRNLENYKDDE